MFSSILLRNRKVSAYLLLGFCLAFAHLFPFNSLQAQVIVTIEIYMKPSPPSVGVQSAKGNLFQLSGSEAFTLAPNPSTSSVTLGIDNQHNMTAIEILDYRGQQVFYTTQTSGQFTTTGTGPGTYVFRVHTEAGPLDQTWVVQ
ncbi:MAG: T9SS type A sorting domain-containing protein [Bacteroidota bacterium]